MANPTDRRYTREHGWIQPTEGGKARMTSPAELDALLTAGEYEAYLASESE